MLPKLSTLGGRRIDSRKANNIVHAKLKEPRLLYGTQRRVIRSPQPALSTTMRSSPQSVAMLISRPGS